MRTRGTRFLAVIIGAAALALVGCSKSSSGSSDTGSSTTSSAYPALAKYIASLETRPTSIGITQPIGKTIPKNKTIDLIECGSPACVVDADALKQAAGTLGWKVDGINAGVTAESIQAAWQQAVQNHPDAVVTSGYTRALFNPQLAQLKAAGIPVIDLTTADPPGNGLSAVFGYGPQWVTQGKILADYMLANSGGKTINELSVTVSAYANITMIANGVSHELKANCPGCTTSTLDVPVTSIGSDLPSRIASYLSSHPNINWVYVGFADMMSGVPSELNASGLTGVHLVTIDKTTASEEYMSNGQLDMSAGFDVSEMMWRGVDYLARLWTGESTTQDTNVTALPLWVLTKANQPTADHTTGYFPYVANYQALYKALWGVK